MAYTYDDFTKAATSAGLMDSFDSNDLSMAQKYPEYGLSLVTLKRDLGNAKTNEQQLLVNEAINQLRKNYGSYWTGDPGSRTYATSYGSKIGDLQKKIDNYGDFKYDKENDYTGLLDRIVNQKKFEYDYETDPLFSAFKKQYNREGDRAVANAIAQAAAATGGRTSSWSDTVAQQQANYYAAMLADKIPELRAQRLDEYNNEFNNLLQSFSSLGADRSTKLAEFNNGLDILRKNLAGYQQQDESDYKRFLDALNAEYQRDRDAVTDAQQEFDNAMKIYQLTGQVTGVLADYLGGSAIAGADAGGGGGGGGGYGSYRGSTSMTSAPETTTTNKALVTVPAYDAKGNLTTRLVTQGAAKAAMNTYLDTAKQRNDINQETYVAMKQEVAKPGSTGGMADVLAIQSDQQRGQISSEEAAKRYANVAKTTGNQYAQKLATDAQKMAETERAARQALTNQLTQPSTATGAASAGAAKASGSGSGGSSSIGKSVSSGSSSSSGGGTFLGGPGTLPQASTGASSKVAAGVKAGSNANKSSGSGLAAKTKR